MNNQKENFPPEQIRRRATQELANAQRRKKQLAFGMTLLLASTAAASYASLIPKLHSTFRFALAAAAILSVGAFIIESRKERFFKRAE